ncbi:MAG: homoserine kinase [Nitrospirota bacterium]
MMQVRVFAPASIGNIGPGFDLLGMAIAGMGDIVTAKKSRKPGVTISKITSEKGAIVGTLPMDADKNTAGISAAAVLSELNVKEGVTLTLHKGVFGTGLGSSAASAVAAAFAVNFLFGNGLSRQELILLAGVAESKVSGGFFLDNIGPSMMGGVTWNNPFTKEVVPLGVIEKAIVVIATPDFPLLTRESRKALPAVIPMKTFISNMAYASMMAWAVAKKDVERFGRSIQDLVAEPSRAPLIKGFDAAKQAALDTGALGCSIAGAGATIFAITNNRRKAAKIGEAMKAAFYSHQVAATIRITTIDKKGARGV